MLITVDVGNTLGEFTGPASIEILAGIAARYRGVKPSMVGEVKRWFLHVAPTLTEELINEVCDYLLIPRSAWPDSWGSGFVAYPYSAEVLAAHSHHSPANSSAADSTVTGNVTGNVTGALTGPVSGPVTGIVALSNLSVADGPARMAQLNEQLGSWLDDIVPSYAIGTRKPHRRCWTTIARRHGVNVGDIVHIGDRIPEDIHGALHAGCRGAILTNTRRVAVPDHLHVDPQVAVVDDLRGIGPVLNAWTTRPPEEMTEQITEGGTT